MTVLTYGTDTFAAYESGLTGVKVLFDADQLEALAACAELINTGRAGTGEGLRTQADVQDFSRRYAFHPRAATATDVPGLRARRERLDAIVVACESGDEDAAISLVNALLADTGAVPRIVEHDGRGPHIHVSRMTAPLADRVAAHLAMGLAGLIVDGETDRVRTCASPGCREVFIDFSRNRSRRYCDNRTCGNRLHVAAYRARKSGQAQSAPG
jgi:predicted RNA-binding Zn ribbon-like protein